VNGVDFMLRQEPKQPSFYATLYDKIPDGHLLKRIDKAVDFSFINHLLKDSYCKHFGRPAKEPEMMAKLLVMQYLYNLSDVRVMEEARLNLAYMWFLGLNPEDNLPDPSLLTKFRTQRLEHVMVDDIIKEVIRQCVDKGMIKGTGISVDCTHIAANTTKKVPERVMKHLAKGIIRNLQEELGEISANINTNIPDYKGIKDHRQAKSVMQEYTMALIEASEKEIHGKPAPKTQRMIELGRQVLGDPRFIAQKGIRSLVDTDARVGYKSKEDSFFGYKAEYAMLAEERLITAVEVHDGAYVDGDGYNELYDRTKECGIELKEAYGDKAYFRKPILDKLQEETVEAIIPVSETVYRLDESRFSYNKDSDQWFCSLGNKSIEKQYKQSKSGKRHISIKFDTTLCRDCPQRESCIGKSGKRKILHIGLNTAEFYEYSQKQKTPEFLEKYKLRAAHEWKNGELKRFHGLYRARGYGLEAMSMQAKLTALAVNLKRIAGLYTPLLPIFVAAIQRQFTCRGSWPVAA
jgi:transposase